MKKIISICFFITCGLYINAQENFSETEGKITQYEVDLTSYDKDPDANALIIYDIATYRFQESSEYGLVLNMTFRKKIKILKQAGLKYANIEIPYYKDKNGSELVQDINAITYNYDNEQLSKTELLSKQIFDEKIDDNYNVKKIALSDVREGSIIEYTYKIATPYYFNMRTWYFQEEIPTIHSKLMYYACPFYEYAFVGKNFDKFEEYDETKIDSDLFKNKQAYGSDAKEIIYTFGMYNTPAFQDNDFVSSPKDFIMSLHFQLVTRITRQGVKTSYNSSWQDIIKKLIESDYFGKYMKSAKKDCAKIIASLDLQNKNEKEKTYAIIDYVKQNYSWNKDNGIYVDATLSDFVKQKRGNDSNINLFLVALLQEAGLKAKPTILSTRNNGSIRADQPFLQFFNYVIGVVEIENDYLFADATEPLLINTELPTRCTNVLGLIVDNKNKEETWITTIQQKRLTEKQYYDITLNTEDCSMTVKHKNNSEGVIAMGKRKLYNGKENNLKDYYKTEYNIEIDSIVIKNYQQKNSPFIIDLHFNQAMQCTPEKIFVHPFCNMTSKENPFKQNKRTLPIDLVFVTSDIHFANIKIPDGYTVDLTPTDLTIDNEIMKYSYQATVDEQKITILSNLVMKYNIYAAESYKELKECFAQMIEAESQMIVFSKKPETTE